LHAIVESAIVESVNSNNYFFVCTILIKFA